MRIYNNVKPCVVSTNWFLCQVLPKKKKSWEQRYQVFWIYQYERKKNTCHEQGVNRNIYLVVLKYSTVSNVDSTT